MSDNFNHCYLGDPEDQYEQVFNQSTHTREEALKEAAEEWGIPVEQLVIRSGRARYLSRKEAWQRSYAYNEYEEWRSECLEDPESVPAKRPKLPPREWDNADDEYAVVWRFAKWHERGTRIWLVGGGD